MPDDELVSLLRDIRDTQRDLWKVMVEAEARNKAVLEGFERERRSRRLNAVLAVLGWLVIVALLALQTSMMWSDQNGSDQDSSAAAVKIIGHHALHTTLERK
jgi:hypothetical protein